MAAKKAGHNSSEIMIVDDDPSVCDALKVVFELEGYKVTSFNDGEAFLAKADDLAPNCVILDMHMPGQSGIEVLHELTATRYPAPILIISGQGDIPTAVKAMKQGAVDFIEKPFDAQTVINQVQAAVTGFSKKRRKATVEVAAGFAGHERLTPRESEVLREVTSGASNKEAGRRLGISPRTIEVHRARIMEKLGARNAADLVRIVLAGQ